jgi:hypothetical protein
MPGEDGETGAGPGKRLIITHMTLENFKSYAGVQHIGPFHKVSKAGLRGGQGRWTRTAVRKTP